MADVTIRPVPYEHKSVLRNLLNLYIYDLSDLINRDCDPHGVFEYKYLDHYWTEQGRHAFFIEVEGQLAGFAMVNRVSEDQPDTNSMAEFFIMRKYRRHGVGASAAHQIFDQIQGSWEVYQFAANTRAQAFWREVIATYTGGQYNERISEEDGGVYQTFQSRIP